jgi:hypothetical protein
MIEVTCPRCRAEFTNGQRDEDDMGTVDYILSSDDLEPPEHCCTQGHVLTVDEWIDADKAAAEEAYSAKYNQ